MNEPNLAVDLNGLKLKNPITVASGTFGFGREYGQYVDLNQIGAISVKGLTLAPKMGNPSPRVAETPCGMLNSVGLQNPGLDYFLKVDLPWLKQFDCRVIANINATTIDEYCEIATRASVEGVDSLELNISCPNVKAGGLAFGTNPALVYDIVRRVRQSTDHHLIVKLSPNVTDIKAIASAAHQGGADCLSLINTLTGMAIDIERRKPILARGIGGLSGPAVKPVALKMVYQVASAVDIPVLGMGGIANYRDAIEFMMAGATAVAIGTANFNNPTVTRQVRDDLTNWLVAHDIEDVNQIVGALDFDSGRTEVQKCNLK